MQRDEPRRLIGWTLVHDDIHHTKVSSLVHENHQLVFAANSLRRPASCLSTPRHFTPRLDGAEARVFALIPSAAGRRAGCSVAL